VNWLLILGALFLHRSLPREIRSRLLLSLSGFHAPLALKFLDCHAADVTAWLSFHSIGISSVSQGILARGHDSSGRVASSRSAAAACSRPLPATRKHYMNPRLSAWALGRHMTCPAPLPPPSSSPPPLPLPPPLRAQGLATSPDQGLRPSSLQVLVPHRPIALRGASSESSASPLEEVDLVRRAHSGKSISFGELTRGSRSCSASSLGEVDLALHDPRALH